jgi:hypothetical protein
MKMRNIGSSSIIETTRIRIEYRERSSSFSLDGMIPVTRPSNLHDHMLQTLYLKSWTMMMTTRGMRRWSCLIMEKRMMRSLKLDPVWVGEVGEVVDGESRRKGMEKLDYWK